MSPRAALKCVLSTALGLSLTALPAPADEILETVYVPTTTLVPTSVVVPTTSYVTTAATIPSAVLPGVYATSYTPTVSYSVLRPTSVVVEPTTYSVLRPASVVVEPTTYVLEPTVYEAPRRFGARLRRRANRPIWGETAYVATTPTYVSTTYWPTTTTLDVPVLAPTTLAYDDPCATTTVVTPAPAAPTAQSAPPENHGAGSTGGGVNPPANGGATPDTRTSRPPAQINSTPANGAPASPAPAGSTPAGNTGAGEPAFEFPQTPAPEKAPAEGGLQSPPADGNASRTAYRPAPTELSPRQALPALGTIRGEVIGATTKTAQPNLKVVFSDAQRTYADKPATTDLSGRFEVALPNGDWLVNVVEEDGKLTPYGQITASNGRFFDERGRGVASLRLNH